MERVAVFSGLVSLVSTAWSKTAMAKRVQASPERQLRSQPRPTRCCAKDREERQYSKSPAKKGGFVFFFLISSDKRREKKACKSPNFRDFVLQVVPLVSSAFQDGAETFHNVQKLKLLFPVVVDVDVGPLLGK